MWDWTVRSKRVKPLGWYWILMVVSCFSTCYQNKRQSRTNTQWIISVCYWFQWDNLDGDNSKKKKSDCVSLISNESRWALFILETVLPAKVCLSLCLLPGVGACGCCAYGRQGPGPLFHHSHVRETRHPEAHPRRSVMSTLQHTFYIPIGSLMYNVNSGFHSNRNW